MQYSISIRDIIYQIKEPWYFGIIWSTGVFVPCDYVLDLFTRAVVQTLGEFGSLGHTGVTCPSHPMYFIQDILLEVSPRARILVMRNSSVVQFITQPKAGAM